MKKLLFVLVIILVYGFSVTNVSAKVTVVEKAKVAVIANDNTSYDGEKDKTKKEEVKAITIEKPACCAGKTSDKSATVEKPAGCCAGKTGAKCAGMAEGAGCAAKAGTSCVEKPAVPEKK